MAKGYEELDVYKRAFTLAVEIHKFSLTLPQIEQYALADQMRRASKSICANIAEGSAKQHFSNAEFTRFLNIALGSSEEMREWLKFCNALDYIDQNKGQNWAKEYDEISKMIYGLARHIKSKNSS